MTSEELFHGYLHPDLEAEEHWTRPGRDVDSRRRIREAVSRRQRFGEQASRLPTGKLRWEQREAAAVADKALDVLRAAGVVLSAGLTEQELDSVEHRLDFLFARDHRALLRAALPVGDGWPPWRTRDDFELARRLNSPFDGVLGEIETGRYWPPSWGDRPADLGAALILAAEKLRDWELLVPVFGHNYLSSSSCPVFSVRGTDIAFAGADLPDYLRREFFPAPPLEPPLGPMDGYSPPWSDIAEGREVP